MNRIVFATVLFFVTHGVLVAQTVDVEKTSKPNATEEKIGFDEKVQQLYKANKLFDKKSYAALRKAYAYSFAKEHASTIAAKWGEESSPFRVFMEKHDSIRDLFFLAVEPEAKKGKGRKTGDDIPAAMELMRTLWEKYPKEFEKYPSLAVAVSLVWDQPNRSLHGSPVGQHKAVELEHPADAYDNFYYYSNVEKAMGDRIQYMPWEFLALLVNHKTSLDERKWALANYLLKRPNIGKVYGEIRYDGPMLAGESPPRISGLEFTLQNQLAYGGVCTCQSDFATRVAKSIGVPAFGAGGANRYGGHHAWVMWIEIDAISPDSMKCSIKSEGRYFGDNYYLGGTVDPPRALGISDRALIMKLYSIGRDTAAYRQSVLLMRAYEHLAATEGLDFRKKLDYLGKVIDLNPFATDAWLKIAQMIRDGEYEKKDIASLSKYVNLLFNVFAQYPDFTWEVFDDLLSFETRSKRRAELYGKLCTLYETAKRPDLACKARLQFAQYLVEEDRIPEALQGLAGTCMKFPDEGAILPQVIKKMDELSMIGAGKIDSNRRAMASFFKVFLPKIPQKRGSAPSDYCMDMYQRGINVFTDVGDSTAAAFYQAELAKLKASAKK